MSDELLRNTRLQVLADALTVAKVGDGWSPQELAVELLDKLDNLDWALTHPPGKPHIVPAYGDKKSRRVVDALVAKPEVLYGILGIPQNIDVAGPWEHFVAEDRWVRRREGGAPKEEIARCGHEPDLRGSNWFWMLTKLSGPGPTDDNGPWATKELAMLEADVALRSVGWIVR